MVVERLLIPLPGSHHRPVIPAGTAKQQADGARLGWSEVLPLHCRVRPAIRTGIKRRQVHGAPKLSEAGSGLSGQRRGQQGLQLGDPSLQVVVSCVALSDPPPVVQRLTRSLISDRLLLGRAALLLRQLQLLLLKL
jgi:hypothetical protein